MTSQGNKSQKNNSQPSSREADDVPWVMTGFSTSINLADYSSEFIEVTKKRLEANRIKQLKKDSIPKVFSYSKDFPSYESSSGVIVSGARDIDRMFAEEEIGQEIPSPQAESGNEEYFDAKGLFEPRAHRFQDPAMREMEVAVHIAKALKDNPEDHTKISRWDQGGGSWSLISKAKRSAAERVRSSRSKGKEQESNRQQSPIYQPRSPNILSPLDDGVSFKSFADTSPLSFELDEQMHDDFLYQEFAQEQSLKQQELEQIARSMQGLAQHENRNLEMNDALVLAQQEVEKVQQLKEQFTVIDKMSGEQVGSESESDGVLEGIEQESLPLKPPILEIENETSKSRSEINMVDNNATRSNGVPPRKSSLPIPSPPIVEVPSRKKPGQKSVSFDASWKNRLRKRSVDNLH